ncbi:MAG: hypothetical protein A2297_08475, partial [Elusimicrobia bacterium RIFOXYB2_FULL_48_7]
ILLTSLSQTKDRITGIKLGADQYLTKPFEPIELTARIEGLLKRVKAEISASPLTALHGNDSVEKEIKKRLEENNSFNIYYMDINNFKPFNDKYGFDLGDQFLKVLAQQLQKQLETPANSRCLLGHIVSDNFVVICDIPEPEKSAQSILGLFSELSLKQYDENTRQRGYFAAKDNNGNDIQAPLMTLAIGILVVTPSKYRHHIQVIERVKELWKKAKLKKGNAYEIG